ncbi:hypothetical protein [Marinicella meishanensis]|uniref:hypothetical protein n=1 Tax=Marinicella meishanensis TaxID=2873263 RepID=UPI001CC0DF21|nr:hypothetical protein [Marinicella sp. NBU2979]
MFKKLLMFVLFMSSGYSLGCLPEKKPSLNFDRYESIYIGQVVGIHLHGYQDKTIRALRDGKEFASFPDSTPEYKVTVIPQRLLKGEAFGVEELKLFGCDVSVPAILERGIFFIQPDQEVFVLYTTDYYDYED